VQASILIRSAQSEQDKMYKGYQQATVGQNVQQQLGQYTWACRQQSKNSSKLNWMSRF